MTQSRMLTDNEVTQLGQDSLEFTALAETLEQIISNSETPLTIGVYGEWGSGKTSLLRLTMDVLKDKKEIKHVWFDAWKFDKAYDLRVALIQGILAQIRNDQSIHDTVKTKVTDLLRRVNWVGLGKTALSLGATLVAPYLAGLPFVPELISKSKEASAELPEGSPETHSDQSKALELIGDFEDEFRDLTHEYVGENGRLVVFVDDLDRCLPPNAIEILEAIKLFLHVPKSVFVIGADRKVIVDGIIQKYERKSEHWGSSYLEKIIQVPLRLPPLRKEVITNHFIKRLDISDNIKEYAPIVAEVGDNPRKIKRLLNNFELQSILATKRGLNVEEKILAKLIVLEFRWRDFYTELIDAYSEGRNLIKHLDDINRADKSERDQKLKEWETGAGYFNDQQFVSFLLEKEPLLASVDLDDYVYLARTTKEVVEDAASYVTLGSASEERKDYDKAIEYYTKAIALDPNHARAYNKRANVYFLGKRAFFKAIEDYAQAIALDPKYTLAYNNMKELLTQLKRQRQHVPQRWDSSNVEEKIQSSGLDQKDKESILSLLGSLKS